MTTTVTGRNSLRPTSGRRFCEAVYVCEATTPRESLERRPVPGGEDGRVPEIRLPHTILVIPHRVPSTTSTLWEGGEGTNRLGLGRRTQIKIVRLTTRSRKDEKVKIFVSFLFFIQSPPPPCLCPIPQRGTLRDPKSRLGVFCAGEGLG